MGLITQEYKNSADVNVAYWKVLNYSINTVFKTVDASIGGYVTKESRDANKECVETRKIRVLPEKFDLYFSTDELSQNTINPILKIYVYAKENDGFFKDAQDELSSV